MGRGWLSRGLRYGSRGRLRGSRAHGLGGFGGSGGFGRGFLSSGFFRRGIFGLSGLLKLSVTQRLAALGGFGLVLGR